jgi:DNA-binding HxlR family transcriptional regulator
LLKQETKLEVCPVNEVLTFLGKSYTLPILHRLYNSSPLRFTELQNLLRVSPKVLTSRLQQLGELGVVARKSYDEIPPRVEYELSAKGEDLLLRIPIDLNASTVTIPTDPGKMFDELHAWSEKYNFATQNMKKKESAT